MRMGLASAVVAALVLAAVGAASPPAPNTVLAVGDSLSVATHPYLRQQLPEYRIARRHAVGLHAHEAAAIVSGSRVVLPSVLVVSAGTNDNPLYVSGFARAIADVLGAAGGRCVVWPTIARPPVAGVTYDGFNRALALAAARSRRLVLVDWAGLVRRNPDWLRRDGVHAVEEGYRGRAAAIARAVKARCAR